MVDTNTVSLIIFGKKIVQSLNLYNPDLIIVDQFSIRHIDDSWIIILIQKLSGVQLTFICHYY